MALALGRWFNPGWCSGVSYEVISGQVGFDIDYRSTVDGIQTGDGEHVSLPFQQFSRGLANRVGSVGSTGGKKPDQREFGVASGVHFH